MGRSVSAERTGTRSPAVSVVQSIDPQPRRVLSFSPSACDFRGFTPGVGGTVDPAGSKNPMAWGFGINPNVLFGMVGMPGSGVRLTPGQTYYVNIRNVDFDTGGNSCQGSTCNVRITVNKPR